MQRIGFPIAVLAIALFALMLRWDVQATANGALYRTDRWTGVTWVIRADGEVPLPALKAANLFDPRYTAEERQDLVRYGRPQPEVAKQYWRIRQRLSAFAYALLVGSTAWLIFNLLPAPRAGLAAADRRG